MAKEMVAGKAPRETLHFLRRSAVNFEKIGAIYRD
jgi:hypothetical protein